MDEQQIRSHENECEGAEQCKVRSYSPGIELLRQSDGDERCKTDIEPVVVTEEKGDDAGGTDEQQPPPVGTVDVPPERRNRDRIGQQLRVIVEARRHRNLYQGDEERDED